MEYKSFRSQEFKVLDSAEGIIEAYVSVFNNVDYGKDRVLPGFFKESIASFLPKGVLYHEWNRPIGYTLVAEEHEPGHPNLPEKLKGLGGLYIKGQLNLDTQDGREAFSNLSKGILTEFSFGFELEAYTVDEKTGVRDLVKGKILEWSPVLYGMNPMTAMMAAKQRQQDATANDPLEGTRLDDDCADFLAKAAVVYKRLAEVNDLAGVKVGKPISAARLERLVSHASAARGIADDLDALVAEAQGKSAEAGTEEGDLEAAQKAADEMESMNLKFRAAVEVARFYGVK